ncbi:glutamine amidotransferase [Bacillus pseudomycoides]|uniref:Glutamine amidotransferase n=1 Tax=Bacillus pseudomycoides TaxID=64104 RepID=A0AA91VBL2_9BACI|nr:MULTISPECIES: DJ-1/PfpI family protein [Bacillus]PEB52131.1 glutamine amidotransferase [Bacillus sp. AFS098217]PED82138.1 glutamine amidotransferase [Bacillus pseudomycoides]PEU10859.1 glutamine amidotransferase [Bacillus sp. AFS019443]PEU20780.1 glutamine amidotransferase [Bacillus sp. AFS014408]PFW61287.1 glutamine amidotransferase [Bacillus sp. AFS075034]
MKKILLFIYPTFAEFEITVTTALLKGDYKIETVGLTKDMITAETGLQVQPHLELTEVRVEDYEAIIIPGGDVIHIKDSEQLFSIVRQFYKKEKLVAAICAGPFVLAAADLLKDVPYTVTMDYRKLDCFPIENFIYKNVVSYKNIITAQGHAFVEFGLAIGEYFDVINEHRVNFYRGNKNIMMEKLLGQTVEG